MHHFFLFCQLRCRSAALATALLSCLLLAICGGCAPKQPDAAAGTDGRQDALPEDVPEELVEAPSLPEDDGIPLTPVEKLALDSTGILDAQMTSLEKRYVDLHFKTFLHAKRKLLERFLIRSESYYPHVQEIFAARGIPPDLATLAFVESGFNPNAVSRAGAGGMWQFIPSTGKKFGLRQDAWLDERRDPFKSSKAAAAYLSKLYGDFGDWYLAIAAYNAGEGKIARALAAAGATTFFDICSNNERLDAQTKLKNETIQYVPQFLALVKIMRNLEKLGFTRPDPRRRHMLAEVSVGAGTDLRRLASKTGLSWEQFSALNPAFRRPVSSPSLKTVAYVPVEKEKIALAWLASRESRIYANWRNYKVRKGDTLAQVAKAHGTTVALLRQANNLQGNALKQGNILLVPANAKAARQAAAAGTGEAAGAKKDTRAQQAGASVQTDAKTGATYVAVRSGDTLYSLARDHGSSVDELRALNKLKPDSSLQIGQKILLAQGKQASGQRQATAPAAGKAAAGKPAAGKTVGGKPAAGATGAKKKDAESRFAVVQTGDTLYSLAKANNTTVDALKKLNGLDAQGARLRPGQLIRLP